MKEVKYDKEDGCIDCQCPYRASKNMGPEIYGVFCTVTKNCGNWCPHFEYKDGKRMGETVTGEVVDACSTVAITCSGTPVVLRVKKEGKD